MDLHTLYNIYLQNPFICTDTRKIKEGCLFFALQGENFDGNKFAEEALTKGALNAVVSDTNLEGEHYIHVADTLQTLQELANYHRRHFNIPFIAITGSNGKTTTKELITTVLSAKYNVHSTDGNYNNHIGVPLTILSISQHTEMAVIEMGANHIGEIAQLCVIAMPTHGLITNIGRAHLEGFGSIEGVKKAKGELFDYLKKNNGHVFVNNDDTALRDLSANIIEKTTYGFKEVENPNLLFTYEADTANVGFSIKNENSGVLIHSNMFGEYNAANVAAAYVVGQHFNVDSHNIIQSLSSFIPGSNRSELVSYAGSTVIKDAYNANPSSMEFALLAFAERYHDGLVILGAMKELGSESESAHQHIINVVEKSGLKKAFLIGIEFTSAFANMNENFLTNFILVDNIEELKKKWDWNDHTGKAILLKGSRAMHLERLLDD
ncbi:MAG TPA: UDP-N-acetylmuramoyl-tripeptide--D-alanyl-D-alanine ligase [Saprospiraceae bacterium]|nr:UDP-N-acetylmuramoyl-tripeptide--D-alanyl-D-alanine ligase [Saprospiraceae bacterium]